MKSEKHPDDVLQRILSQIKKPPKGTKRENQESPAEDKRERRDEVSD